MSDMPALDRAVLALEAAGWHVADGDGETITMEAPGGGSIVLAPDPDEGEGR